MSEEQIVFRPKRTIRRVILASSVIGGVFVIGLIAFSLFLLVRYKDPGASLFTGSLWIDIAIALVISAGMSYMAVYWGRYAIVVGKTYIAQEGLPHLLAGSHSIAFTEIDRVAHGNGRLLKVVPLKGPTLAVNLNWLEGEPTELVNVLRERIPAQRFERDLESKIIESNRLNLVSAILIVATLAIVVLPLGALYVREPILANTAWFEVGPIDDGLRILEVETSSDGSVWLASEDRNSRRDDELILTHIRSGEEPERVEVSSNPLLARASKEADLMPNALDSLVADSKDRLWLLFNGGRSAFFLGDSGWSEVPITFGPESYEITDLVRAGNYLWARVPEREALLRIDDTTLELKLIGPLSTGEGDSAVELKPWRLRGSGSDGAILIGEYSTGPTGLLYINHDGRAEFMTHPVGGPSESIWRARGAVTDDFGRIHVYYSSREVCVAGQRMIKVGTRLENAEWVWRDLVYEADCDIDPIFDDIEFDTLGRVWVQAADRSPLVFTAPSGDLNEITADYITKYTRDNSGYNDGDLFMGQDGRVLAIRGFEPQVVHLDAGESLLPMPLPNILAWALDHPFAFQIAALIVVLPFIIIAARRNLER